MVDSFDALEENRWSTERTGVATLRLDDPPEAARLVARALTSDYPVYAAIRLPLPAEEALRRAPRLPGVHRPDGSEAPSSTSADATSLPSPTV